MACVPRVCLGRDGVMRCASPSRRRSVSVGLLLSRDGGGGGRMESRA